MWVRKRIDIRWLDIAAGLANCLAPGSRVKALAKLESLWSAEDDAFACLSVRSGFDLLFQALELPPGSEIILSAVTIPDMPRIVQEHQLQTVPVDLNMATMAPDLDALRAALTPQTKVIVIAHLFGGKVDLTEVLAFAKEHNLLLVEDCAQAFVGHHETGHPGVDISMYSFGPIKTNTSLGGGLFRVRRPQLLSRMRELQAKWPEQTRSSYARRLLKYAFVQVISLRLIAGTVAKACRLVGRDHDGIATSMARGFAGPNFFDRIRKQPSTPLLLMLHRRLLGFKPELLAGRVKRAEYLNELLGDAVPRLGDRAIDRAYWVFPIVVNQPEQLARKLWAKGFDATWHSSLTIVQRNHSLAYERVNSSAQTSKSDPRLEANGEAVGGSVRGSTNGRSMAQPNDSSRSLDESSQTNAERLLKQTVFLPFSRKMSFQTLQRMAAIVLESNPQTDIEIEFRARAGRIEPAKFVRQLTCKIET